ncbi:MAG TPA: molybdopterin-dependent oxidoreductase [Acidimicrobiales bacterium]|nr:molybdopterin-dependent oxidoreductase [Acidimicrobiales bacterium]
MAPLTHEATESEPVKRTAVGRRTILGLSALGALGIAFGSSVQNFFGSAFGSGLGGLLPGGDRFRIYSITGTYPKIADRDYRLKVSGLVERPKTFTLADLKALPVTSFTKPFQCVTGWRVPNVAWEGVRLSDILDTVGVRPEAVALTFESYDRLDTESLTIDQAHLPDVIVAYRMLGAPVTTEHGGPVRLYVAQMFGYKSLKWLSAIRVVNAVRAGFWEQNGYPVNGWLDGSTGPTNPDPRLD